MGRTCEVSSICHTTTRATRLSRLYSTKYICLETPFARQRRSTSVLGCNPSFDHLTRSNVVCDRGMEGDAEREDCTYSIIFIFYRTCHDDFSVISERIFVSLGGRLPVADRLLLSWLENEALHLGFNVAISNQDVFAKLVVVHCYVLNVSKQGTRDVQFIR
ncbi:hypothetical protein EDD15DRAFT_2323976 [Pisolithus albus]|nr:hypothetical protein EDD15DRAFT_2323976 [Pisolithus albus]